MALYYGDYSLDGPENCSISPNLTTSIHRMEFLGNQEAGSRWGWVAMAHHTVEGILPTHDAVQAGQRQFVLESKTLTYSSVLNIREQAKGEGDLTAVQQGWTAESHQDEYGNCRGAMYLNWASSYTSEEQPSEQSQGQATLPLLAISKSP